MEEVNWGRWSRRVGRGGGAIVGACLLAVKVRVEQAKPRYKCGRTGWCEEVVVVRWPAVNGRMAE